MLVVHQIATNGSVQTQVPKFQMLDHLGSVIALYDTAVVPLERQRYNAWGERRDYVTMNALSHYLPFPTQAVRGYTGHTGHEHAEAFGLIHMNGRCAMPNWPASCRPIRLLSSPSSPQSYNMYSYVLNNPLAYTDPSGYFKIKKWAGTIVAVVGTVYCYNACTWVGYAIVGAASGGTGAAINGGNIVEGAVIGGISGAAFYGVGAANYSCFQGAEGAVRVAAFGAVGGINGLPTYGSGSQ